MLTFQEGDLRPSQAKKLRSVEGKEGGGRRRVFTLLSASAECLRHLKRSLSLD